MNLFKYSTVIIYIILAIISYYLYICWGLDAIISSLIISVFSSFPFFFRAHRRLLLFNYILCYITFSILAIFIRGDYVAAFAFSFFLVDYPLYNFFNKISLKKYGREIGIVGRNFGYNNTLIDLLYTWIGIVVIFIYVYLILIFGG